ncbi:hypothetical protein BVC71_09415 [Marivivens niveibacter]|uniref:AAA family ATPase n=1 Tax=Marivivens niveibacter TaxID=1930667 RepID=A0A251WWW9_9RHOB|nr:AAA domain-containing protein [Marivivens niveibacter]OUD08927.1 hypothetical protein BVC71_09415 [Marivivens niveibacter]
MSLLLNTVRAFPRGRTIEELHALVGTSFSSLERHALLAELETLLQAGEVQKTSNGKWKPVHRQMSGGSTFEKPSPSAVTNQTLENEILRAAKCFVTSGVKTESSSVETAQDVGELDAHALVRYYRSALRSDPRGALQENVDRYGTKWHLLSGRNRLVPSDQNPLTLRIVLDDLSPEFRTSLLKREANENALAIGWPMYVGRKEGVPSIWPVGLIAANWRRQNDELLIQVDADDVLVNPKWVKDAANKTGWRRDDLAAVFDDENGVGLGRDDFVSRLKEAAATSILSDISASDLTDSVNVNELGIHNAAGLFLHDDSSFTSGAVRDLDEIGTWDKTILARTALGVVLGLEGTPPRKDVHSLNVGPLNAEQIEAVSNACSAPLSVVTGPPGTGKSQAIVSMAASVLSNGGSVLVASKNHQALDAVEDRLGSIAKETPFIVRTLDPAKNKDVSFASLLKELVTETSGAGSIIDQSLVADCFRMAERRSVAFNKEVRRAKLECQIADVHDQLVARSVVLRSEVDDPELDRDDKQERSMVRRFLDRLIELILSTSSNPETLSVQKQSTDLNRLLTDLRTERDALGESFDLVDLTNRIAELTKKILPLILANRTNLTHEDIDALDQRLADLEFSPVRNKISSDIAYQVVEHRPLWLASVLGTPNRIPLIAGLFDLVIFDEASQCDIASAFPLMARAKRAVVVGDNNQLNSIAPIGQAQDRNLMQAQGLPVSQMARFAQSRQSLFDFARRVPGAEKTLLKQQYRSAGPIVDYISKNFYGGELKTAYDPSFIKPPKSQKPGIHWTNIPAPLSLGSGNVNSAEITAIVSHLEHLLVHEDYSGTVGVTSPFRDQVAAIGDAVRQKIPEQKLIGAEFKVATVDGFQGQERDLIIFSPTLGAASAPSALTFMQSDPRRLNVAISRARAVAHVFGDLSFARSRKVRTLASLAAAATEPRSRVGEGRFDSHWEEIVYYGLKKRGLDPKPQYDIAGRRLDFALFGASGIKLDLEVDGRKWHQNADGTRKISDYWRDHQLISLGWRVRRFWVDELAKDLEACFDIIENDLS